ncbi:MAG: outer membrane lipoprotein carrier protein LolA [Elusimicrobiota bacterium]
MPEQLRKFLVFFLVTFYVSRPTFSFAADAPAGGVALSTAAILERVRKFDDAIGRATFKFEEEFVLAPTNEKEKLNGKVYLDRPSQRVRLDYTGKVKYKVWIDKDRIYFYDQSLEQVVIRGSDDFMKLHFQAFLDLPILFDMSRFGEKYDFSPVDAPAQISTAAGPVSPASNAPADPSLSYLKAVPKGPYPSYVMIIGVDRATGRPQNLELILENYRAKLEIKEFNPNARFSDTIFEKKFPAGVAVLDLTEKKEVIR